MAENLRLIGIRNAREQLAGEADRDSPEVRESFLRPWTTGLRFEGDGTTRIEVL